MEARGVFNECCRCQMGSAFAPVEMCFVCGHVYCQFCIRLQPHIAKGDRTRSSDPISTYKRSDAARKGKDSCSHRKAFKLIGSFDERLRKQLGMPNLNFNLTLYLVKEYTPDRAKDDIEVVCKLSTSHARLSSPLLKGFLNLVTLMLVAVLRVKSCDQGLSSLPRASDTTSRETLDDLVLAINEDTESFLVRNALVLDRLVSESCIHPRLPLEPWERRTIRLENATQQKWNWGPFLSLRTGLADGYTHVHWIDPTGEEVWEAIPTQLANNLQTLQQFWSYVTSQGTHSTPTNISRGNNGSGSGGSFIGIVLTGIRNLRSWLSISAGASSYCSSASTDQLCVFFATKQDRILNMARLPVHGSDDDCFFHQLRNAYNGSRNRFAGMFGIRGYDHCQFIKMEKTSDMEVVSRRHEPPHIKENLPTAGHPDYDFVPVTEYPPITPAQFYRRYYMCYRGKAPHRSGGLCCTHPCRPTLSKSLDRIPKRRHDVDMLSNDTDVFWGLEAVEAILAWRVVLYQGLILIGPILFWILWLTIFDHSADLQNASVPLMATVALVALFRHHLNIH